MRRRDLLLAGTAAAVGAATPWRRAQAAAPGTVAPPTAVLTGSPRGLAGFDAAQGRWWSWALARDAAAPAVADARAAWAVDRDGRLWRRDADDGTVRPVAVPAPAHALVAASAGDAVFVAHGAHVDLLDGDGRLRHRWACRDLAGRREGPAVALAWHAGRRSLVASLPVVGELWTVSLDPDAPPVFDGLVHDYRLGEALPTPGFLGVRRAPLAAPPTRLWCDGEQPWVAGLEADGTVGIVHLDVRRRIAGVARPGLRADAGVVVPGEDGGPRWWVPVDGGVAVVDARRWTVAQPLVPSAPVDRLARMGDRLIVAGHDAAGVWWGRVERAAVVETGRIDGVRGPVEAIVASAADGPSQAAPGGAAGWLITGADAPEAVALDARGLVRERRRAAPTGSS